MASGVILDASRAVVHTVCPACFSSQTVACPMPLLAAITKKCAMVISLHFLKNHSRD
jgi:hypothetical protein